MTVAIRANRLRRTQALEETSLWVFENILLVDARWLDDGMAVVSGLFRKARTVYMRTTGEQETARPGVWSLSREYCTMVAYNDSDAKSQEHYRFDGSAKRSLIQRRG